MHEKLVIRPSCSNQVLLRPIHFLDRNTPTNGVNRPEMRVLDLTQLLVPICTHRPYDPGLIFTTWDQVVATWVEIKAPHCRLVATHRILAHPLIDWVFVRPGFYCIVIARWKKLVFLWVPFHVLDVLTVAWKHAHAGVFKDFTLFLFKDPYALVTRACCNIGPTGTPSYALDLIFMAF